MPLPRNDRRLITTWCLYDWANSAFTTLVVTFVYGTYFNRALAPDEITGTAWWSRAIALTALVVAVAGPILGAMADRSGRRRRYLATSTLVCVAATAALTFVAPDRAHAALLALVIVTIANIGYELGNVFYYSYLPDITTPERLGRVSGWGWALGYAGGLLCLVLALVGFVRPDVPWFGLSKAEGFNVRATNLLVAGWFAAFSLPLLMVARGEEPRGGAAGVRAALSGLRATFHEVRRFREAALLLLARVFYNDGLTTIFAFGGIYAAGTFGFSFADILVFGIALNVAAGLGAWVFGFVDDRFGGKRTVLASVIALGAATALAVGAPSRGWLWVAGILIGIFAGPNQAASRSLLARFVPDGRENEFFGFFAFSGKLAAFAGPLLLGVVAQAANSQRAGLATLLVFFAVGGVLVSGVNETRGIAAARAGPGGSA